MSQERLAAIAIKRGDEVHDGGRNGHWFLRRRLDPKLEDSSKTVPGDIDGFLTNEGRFVDRDEAKEIALMSGQISSRFERELLSSDIIWEGTNALGAGPRRTR